MKKLKKFQKFALSTKQANNVKGGYAGAPGTNCSLNQVSYPTAALCAANCTDGYDSGASYCTGSTIY